MWMGLDERHARLAEDEINRLGQTIVSLKGRLAALEKQLAEGPERVVEKYIDEDVLNKAEREADRAFSSRERAWRTLLTIKLLHHEIDEGKCRCGARLARCKTAGLLAEYDALSKWERQQVAREARDLPNGLPEGHPALLDRRRKVGADDDPIDLEGILD